MDAAQEASAPLQLSFFPPLLPHGRHPFVADRTPSPASSHGALHSVPSPLFFPVRPGKHPSLFPSSPARQSTQLFPAPYSPMETSRSFISSMVGTPRSASARLPLPKQRAPFLAVLRGARRQFDKMRSKPRAAAALLFDLHSPRRVSSLLCSLRSPIHDVVETRGEKTPAALAAIIFFLCSVKLLNCCVCLIAASGRHRASCLARSTKCRAMWTAHASSPDSFRLIDL
jgi:hypothetical protein